MNVSGPQRGFADCYRIAAELFDGELISFRSNDLADNFFDMHGLLQVMATDMEKPRRGEFLQPK